MAKNCDQNTHGGIKDLNVTVANLHSAAQTYTLTKTFKYYQQAISGFTNRDHG